MKKSISKILSAVLASAMVVTSLSVPAFATTPQTWSMGADTKTRANDEQIATYTVSAARTNPEFNVPVKIFNNTNTENYTVYVNYDPTELMCVGATQGDFSLSTSDLLSKSVNHVPDAANPSFTDVSADGTKTEAQLGKIKFAYSASVAGAEAATASEINAFSLQFKVVKADPKQNDRYHISFTTDATGAVLYGSDFTTTSSDVSNCYVAITATQGGSSGGGGGGGGSSSKPQATTSAANEGTTASENVTSADGTTSAANEGTTNAPQQEPTKEAISVEITNADGETIIVNPPVVRDPDKGNYTDTDSTPWAKDSIQKLAELGILTGVGDGLFGPGLPCKRCDFAILINRALGISVEVTKNFTDNVDQSKYYYNDCAMGYSAGILSGYGDNNFKPENYCTREEMFVLTAKTLEYLGEDVTSTSLEVNNKYSDVADISWWSAPYCAFLTDKAIVNGNADGTINPDAYITRAEMAVMIDRDYEYAYTILQKIIASGAEANQKVTEEGAYGDTTHVDDNGQTLVVTQELLVEMSAKLTEYVDAVSADSSKLSATDLATFNEDVDATKAIAEKVLTEIPENELNDVNSEILGIATRVYELANNNGFTVDFQTDFDALKALAEQGVEKN